MAIFLVDYISNKMIFRHRKCKFLTVALVISSLICLPHTILCLAPAPVDYLVPPSPPQGFLSTASHFKQTHTQNPQQNLLLAESRTIPKFVNPPTVAAPIDKPTGLLTRVARWFGFANKNAITDQQSTDTTNKQAYYYPKPHQLPQNEDKENCYLCNKYPWVPMMPNSIQYPKQMDNQWDSSKYVQLQHYPSHGNTEIQKPAPQIHQSASSVRQRAVKFNIPLPYVPPNDIKQHQDANNHIPYSTGPFLPIPIPPLFSNSALPPLYNAQNFLPASAAIPSTIQELPSTEHAHFAENIAQHSEIHAEAIPTQIPSTNVNSDASFEIIKSHQLVDYVSSIEYPASYVPTHTFDVSTPQVPLLSVDNQRFNTKVKTGLYQHSTFSPNLSQHIPASEILSQPGSFIAVNQQQATEQSEVYEQTHPAFSQQPLFAESVPQYLDDNYVAASHKNSSIFEQQQAQQHAQHNNFDAWTLESNDYIYATSTPATASTAVEKTTFTTETDSSATAQPQTQENEIEFLASIQTNAQQHSNSETNNARPHKSKQRETPKRLLDSPIQHINGNLGAPRPFTRDPSDLTFRLGLTNHKLTETNQVTSSHEVWKPQIAVSSSTFSSIDASGQYAGMSPPSLPSTYNSDPILLPHLTTKNRPRPFETTRVNLITKSPSIAAYSNTWVQKSNAELHTPQESMLVKSHVKPAAQITTTTTVKPRTTKYLTKILASNLRELLQREHEPTRLKLSPNALDIDINKLQKNIDDWTEQEYTSLSHRPSTPTIRGRSKNIPSEYLPTTVAGVKNARQSKTTRSFTDSSELPSSINNLEPLYERESTKHYQYTQITDNHLRDFYTNFESMKSKSSLKQLKSKTTPATPRTSKATTTTTTEKPLSLRAIQNQEPEELWKKAKVSISPKTQEKVYVVTPQPKFFPQRFYSTTTTTTTEKSLNALNLGSAFKSPRFLVRPTPGNDTRTISKENSKEIISKNTYLKPEWFGLRGLSAYVPSEPVEIIDGNSKVINIVTPPSNLEQTTRHNIMDLTKDRHTAAASKRKATMAPLPR